MANLLRTERLILRDTNLTDAEYVLELLNTEEYIRNIGNRGVTTLEQAEEYIKTKSLAQLEEMGFGNFTVLLGEKRIGNCGVFIRDGMEHPDLGFAFLPQYQNRGYGFEASLSVLDFVRNNTKIKILQAITLPTNLPSVCLLNKLGFKYIRKFFLPGDPEELLLLELRLDQKTQVR